MGAKDSSYTQPVNMQTLAMIDKLENTVDYGSDLELLKKLSVIKHKEVLRESLMEMNRKGQYVCIYPAKGSEIYDQYFAQPRPLNRFLNKCLFSDDFTQNIRIPKSTKGGNQENAADAFEEVGGGSSKNKERTSMNDIQSQLKAI